VVQGITEKDCERYLIAAQSIREIISLTRIVCPLTKAYQHFVGPPRPIWKQLQEFLPFTKIFITTSALIMIDALPFISQNPALFPNKIRSEPVAFPLPTRWEWKKQ
jgi:hypothetical protein